MIQLPELGGIAPGFDAASALEAALAEARAQPLELCRCELLHVERGSAPTATFLARVVLRDRRNGDFDTAFYRGRIASRGTGADLQLQAFPSAAQSPQLAALLDPARLADTLLPAVRRYLGDGALRVELLSYRPQDGYTLRVSGRTEAIATVFECGDAATRAQQFEALRRVSASASTAMLWPGVLGFDAARATLWTTHAHTARPLLGYPARRSVAHAPWVRVGRALAALHREELPALAIVDAQALLEASRRQVETLAADESSLRGDLQAVHAYAVHMLRARPCSVPATLHGALDVMRLQQVADRIGFDETARFASGPAEVDFAALLVSLEAVGVFPAVARRALDTALSGYAEGHGNAIDPNRLDACFRLQLLAHAHDLWRAGGALARGRVRTLLRRAQRGLTHVLVDTRQGATGADAPNRPLPRVFQEPAAV